MTVTRPRVSDGGDKFEWLLCKRSLWDDPGGTCFPLLGKPVPLDRLSCLAPVERFEKYGDLPRHATSPSPCLPGSVCDVARCIHHRCAYYQPYHTPKHTKRELIWMFGRCTSPASSCTFSYPVAGLYWDIVRQLADGRSRPGFELGIPPAGRGGSISLCPFFFFLQPNSKYTLNRCKRRACLQHDRHAAGPIRLIAS